MLGQRAHRRDQAGLADKLTATRKAFEEFAYTVAHDLNAPLRTITNFSQLLENRWHDGQLDGKALHYIDLIASNSRKAQERLAGLLQYSRLDTVPLAIKDIDSGEIVRQCLKQLKKDIESRGAQISSGPLPQVEADGDRLALLFYCLLTNALKFCDKLPEIEIAARRSHKAWIFSVKDNGIGIAPKDHESIFGVFRLLHAEAAYPGIGMGLALAQHIAELHGGQLWVESHLGQGATFYFSLPDALLSGGSA